MKRTVGVLTLVSALVLAVAGLAVADDAFPDGDGGDATEGTSQAIGDEIWFYLDDEAKQLVYWLPTGEDGEEAPECFAPEGADGGDGFPDTDGEGPDGCEYADVERNGKVTHGSVVSSFVHSLKDAETYDRDLHGPRGHWVSQVAKSDDGKNFDDLDGALDGDEELAELHATPRGKAKGHEKKKDR